MIMLNKIKENKQIMLKSKVVDLQIRPTLSPKVG